MDGLSKKMGGPKGGCTDIAKSMTGEILPLRRLRAWHQAGAHPVGFAWHKACTSGQVAGSPVAPKQPLYRQVTAKRTHL